MLFTDDNLNFPRLLGMPKSQGVIRFVPEDFQVDEELGFELSGAGEHVFLHMLKRGDNTQWQARQIAKLAGVKPADVSYAGLKDRHAVTSQWYSVWLPGKDEPDWTRLNSDSARLLAVHRHHRKLRRGAHELNHFKIRIRNLTNAADMAARVELLRQQGVPNYFGEQRFGQAGGNLQMADAVLCQGKKIRDRHKRGMYLSAARSYLFNLILARRIEDGSLAQYLPGDKVMADASSNLLQGLAAEDVQQGLDELSLHLSAPLPGRGRLVSEADVLALEQSVLEPFQGWCEGLAQLGLASERRPVRFVPRALQAEFAGDDCVISFSLGSGQYATAVLREVCDYQVAESGSI